MFINAQFPLWLNACSSSKSNNIIVPESALVHNGQLTGIYTVGNNNTGCAALVAGRQ